MHRFVQRCGPAQSDTGLRCGKSRFWLYFVEGCRCVFLWSLLRQTAKMQYTQYNEWDSFNSHCFFSLFLLQCPILSECGLRQSQCILWCMHPFWTEVITENAICSSALLTFPSTWLPKWQWKKLEDNNSKQKDNITHNHCPVKSSCNAEKRKKNFHCISALTQIQAAQGINCF